MGRRWAQDGPGTHRGGRVVMSEDRKRRRDSRRAKQEARWAARSGPVEVSYVCVCPSKSCRVHRAGLSTAGG